MKASAQNQKNQMTITCIADSHIIDRSGHAPILATSPSFKTRSLVARRCVTLTTDTCSFLLIQQMFATASSSVLRSSAEVASSRMIIGVGYHGPMFVSSTHIWCMWYYCDLLAIFFHVTCIVTKLYSIKKNRPVCFN